MITLIATSFNEKKYNCPIVDSMLNQSNKDWKLIVYNNGPNAEMYDWIKSYNDERITYTESIVNTGNWGTANRQDSLDRIVTTPFVIQTSIQDYYLPNAIEEITNSIKSGADFIHYQAINHLFRYNVLSGEIAFGHLDWGQVCTKTEYMKKTGIVKKNEFCSDWYTFQEVLKLCKRVQKINSIITIHN